MKFDHDVDAIAYALADLLERFERLAQIRAGNVLPAGFLCRDIERPDFHGGDAVGKKVLGKLVSPLQKTVEIVIVLSWTADAVICGLLPLGVAHIGVAGAGVVGTDLAARKTTEQLGDGQVGGLAEQIPEADINGRIP